MYPIFLVVFWKCSKEAEFWYMKFCLLKKHCAFFCAGWHFIFAKWSMQNTSPENCSSHQSCWGCGLSWIHLISSGANSTCVSGSNLGKPILRYKISKFYNTAKTKNVQVTNVTHSNIFENANPLHENRMTAPEAGLTPLPWHINPPIICITFDLKTCLVCEISAIC